MLLASQVAGALAAALIVFALARGLGVQRRQATAGIAVVSIVLAAVLSLPGLQNTIKTTLDQRRANAVLSPQERLLLPGVYAEVNDGFVSWVIGKLQPGETFELVLGEGLTPDEVSNKSQWILFRLPTSGVMPPVQPDWVVLYEVPVSQYRDASRYEDVQVFQPGFAIARPAVAG
ncbi:MAG: hypothetical protein J0H06_11710 [Actinobacteria bacterium]|nr:hypothetical protein [Actinomycetota bacterium]